LNIAIIGGGIAGMSTAYYINKYIPEAKVDVYEKGSDIGGLAGVMQVGDSVIEKYYHHLFTHDKYYLELADELGLTSQLIWKESKVGFYHSGGHHAFTTPLDLLRFKPLSFPSRIKFGLSSLFISKYKDIDKLESMTTEEFMVKYVGKQGWEVIWKPMLRIKFGDNYNKIPAVWIWERIVQRFKSRTGGGKQELLGYMKGSFKTFNEKLLDTLVDQDINMHLNAAIDEIVIEENKCKGIRVNEEFIKYDTVICTAALPIFVKLCKNAPENYLNPLRAVEYDCALVALMTLSKPVGNMYWLNIADNNIPFGGVIEHTNFIGSENYGGKTLLYFSKYLNVNDPLMHTKDEEIQKLYTNHLKKIYPNFDERTIENFVVSRDRYAQPIWPMKYSQIKPEYKTPIDGLFLSNTAQIYPNDRGMNFSVKLGKEVSEVVRNTINS